MSKVTLVLHLKPLVRTIVQVEFSCPETDTVVYRSVINLSVNMSVCVCFVLFRLVSITVFILIGQYTFDRASVDDDVGSCYPRESYREKDYRTSAYICLTMFQCLCQF